MSDLTSLVAIRDRFVLFKVLLWFVFENPNNMQNVEINLAELPMANFPNVGKN